MKGFVQRLLSTIMTTRWKHQGTGTVFSKRASSYGNGRQVKEIKQEKSERWINYNLSTLF
jgi:hypothetical protein